MSVLAETARGVVNAWQCDQMGHLNVRGYVEFAHHATGNLAERIGLDRRASERTGLVLAPVEERILFQRELLAGDIVTVRSGLRAVGHRHLKIFHQIVNPASEEVSALFETVVVLFDQATARATALPGDIREAAGALLADETAFPPPAPPRGPKPPAKVVDGFYETYRDSVDAWDCDHMGRMVTPSYIARFSSAAGHVFLPLGIDRVALRAQGIGGAALDYTLTYRKPLYVGTAIVVKTGLLEVGNKVMWFCHHLVNAATDEIATTVLVAAVNLDLRQRRALTVPDDVRRRAASLIVKSDESAA